MRAARELAKAANVSHVSFGHKETAGRSTGRPALKAHVARKGGVPAAVAAPRVLPLIDGRGRVIGEIESDIVETGGAPELLGLRSGSTLIAFDFDRGVAGLTFPKGARRYVLTNAHVACDLAQGGAAGPLSWRTGDRDVVIGPVVAATPIGEDAVARGDCAVISVGADVIVDPYRVEGVDARIHRLDDLRPSQRTHWFAAHGEVLACDRPEKILTPALVEVDGLEVYYEGFWQFRMIQGRALGGQSGALLCRTVNGLNVGCGLVFGRASEDLIWAFPFRSMFNRIYDQLEG